MEAELYCATCCEFVDSGGSHCPECSDVLVTRHHSTGRHQRPRQRAYAIKLCKKCNLRRRHNWRSDAPHKTRSACVHCERDYLMRYRKTQWQRVKARNTYKGMISRCTDPTHGRGRIPTFPRYEDYGGQGVGVCERWQGEGGFERFLEDLGLPPERDSTLDRIDYEGDYSPENTRWTDPLTQQQNKRNTRWITGPDPKTGEPRTECVAEWARLIGVDESTIRHRIDLHGWTPWEAVTVDQPEEEEDYEEAPF